MSLLPMLKNICGAGNATDSETTCLTYTLTQSPNLFLFPLKKPDYVAYPKSSEEVAAVMRLADRTKTPVLVRGAGSSSMSGNVCLEGGILIDLRHMDKILEINEDNMVVVAEGGCPVNKILRACYDKGLLLSLAPEWQAAPTIGASINTNATGHYINKAGRLADQVVGLEVVLPTGEIVTLGSGAYKWGAHYHRYMGIPDLTGMFMNAGGTMGAATQVALRLKTWPKMAHLTYYWKIDQINEVTKAHYDLQRYAEIFSLELLNNNTALPLQGIGLTPPVKLRLAGPPNYWWFTMYCDTLYGGGLKPTESGSVGLNSACTMIYSPTMLLPEIYKLGYDIFVKKYRFPEGHYLYYGWADRNAMDPYPMFFFDGTDKAEVKKFGEFWREFHLEAAKIGCVSYNIGIGHPQEMKEWLGPAYELYKKVKKVVDPSGILNMPAA